MVSKRQERATFILTVASKLTHRMSVGHKPLHLNTLSPHLNAATVGTRHVNGSTHVSAEKRYSLKAVVVANEWLRGREGPV